MTTQLLPRASLRDVVRRSAPLVGPRLDPLRPRGFVSPVEARLHMGIPYGRLEEEERQYLEASARTVRSDLAVLVRAAVAHALAPPGGARTVDRPHIVSARVDNMTIDHAIEAIFATPRRRGARMIHFVHPHALNVAHFDRGFTELLLRGDLVLPDGIGVRLAASLLGVAMRHNLNGTDLLPLLCGEAAARRLPLVLVGGADGVADACAGNLCSAQPDLRIALTHHGYLDSHQSARVTARIREVGESLVLVGMGSPVQERWAWRWLREIDGLRVITVGGLFDFFSGRVRRAPVAWRELGLEWVWRLRQEPRRLARRYLVGNPLFLALALSQRLRHGRAT